jgi:hypothetical protein
MTKPKEDGGMPNVTQEDLSRMTDGLMPHEYELPVDAYKTRLYKQVEALLEQAEMDVTNPEHKIIRHELDAQIAAYSRVLDLIDGSHS